MGTEEKGQESPSERHLEFEEGSPSERGDNDRAIWKQKTRTRAH